LDAARLADQAQLMPRAFVLSDTAPAEAILFSMNLFSQVPDCKYKVIDVSGDGTPNSGSETRQARNTAERAGITINGIAIESMGLAITGFSNRRSSPATVLSSPHARTANIPTQSVAKSYAN